MFGITLALIAGIFTSSACLTPPSDSNLYLVKAVNRKHQDEVRVQTGFRIRKMRGIITALHGVLDSPSITVASTREGRTFTASVKIIYFDTDRDLAVLFGPELDATNDDGFEVANEIKLKAFDTVYVRGHPYGTGLLGNKYFVADPVLQPLKMRLPSEMLVRLRNRNSPNPEQVVVNIQGNLAPGHSGAPIFDVDGEVIAVANGGLEEGRSDKSWGIPLQGVNWVAWDNNTILKTLAQSNSDGLFSMLNEKDVRFPDVNRPNLDFRDSLIRIVSDSGSGFTNLVGKRDSREDTFESKIALPGAVETIVTPYHSVQAWMSYADKMEDAEGYYNFLIQQLRLVFPAWKHREENPYVQAPLKSFVSRSNDGQTYISLYFDRRNERSFYVKLNVFTYARKP